MKKYKFLTIEDLRIGAKKRIPKLAFDYLDGGAGSEENIYRNRSCFDEILLCPEYIRDVTNRSQEVKIFGHTYDAPIGVSPVGLANLIWPNTDTYLARMAKKRNVPYLLSAVGTTSIEEIAKIAPEHTWFQLYVPGQNYICFDLIRRAKEAGIKVLVLTVDIPEPSKRLRDLRNDFTLPFKITPKIILDILRKPRWVSETLANGTPRFENMVPYITDVKNKKSLGPDQVLQTSARLSEDFVKRIRDSWAGTFVIKGILSPTSAKAAMRIGADGIIVSNHGGRQLDCAPASIETIANITKTCGPKITVMLDSGIRGGTDIVKAFASGASYTFSGRSFIFGIGALGEQGGEHALDIMSNEVDKTLAQVGCNDITKIDRSYIYQRV